MYDYVIVGAGSAGCVLANRLSENPDISVLLVEAGGPDTKREIHIPAAFVKLYQTAYDWNYQTEPQPHLDDRQLYWPRGKVLGGSSSINAMIYIRGNQQDYNDWAALGNELWGFQDVLPYFIKAENQTRGASEYHGVQGPLNVTDLEQVNPLSQIFVQAGAELGLPINPDFNGASQGGVGLYQITQKNGQRHSVATAYLKPVLHRPNLTVETYAHVTAITFQGRRVIGISYEKEGETYNVPAGREVILCGGAINSPQLLQLSGIGPADHLKALDIPIIRDLPGVGQNLQDHLIVSVTYRCKQPVSLASVKKPSNLLYYFLSRKGKLSSNLAEAGGFIRSNGASDRPDLQFHFVPLFFLQHGLKLPSGHGFTIAPTLIHPQSRGHISLNSNNPFDAPQINPNYFSDETDLETLVAGVKWAKQIANAAAFVPYRGPEMFASSQAQSDDDIRQFVRETAETVYHPVGTCKMGVDPMAVVDPQLRVHGIDGLRVVDASIMPKIIGGNTNAPTVMIAEKAADLIKNGK